MLKKKKIPTLESNVWLPSSQTYNHLCVLPFYSIKISYSEIKNLGLNLVYTTKEIHQYPVPIIKRVIV